MQCCLKRLHCKYCRALPEPLTGSGSASGGSGSKMVFLDPPPENLEHWQQLERALELLERQVTQNSSTALPSPGPDRPAPQVQDNPDHQDASSAAARSGEQARQPARQAAGCESIRSHTQQSGGRRHAGEARMVSLQAQDGAPVLRRSSESAAQTPQDVLVHTQAGQLRMSSRRSCRDD